MPTSRDRAPTRCQDGWVEENRLRPADAARLGVEIARNVVRYPLSLKRRVFWSGEPQAWFGLTDHPLDRDGGQVSDPFSTLRKLTSKRASSVLGVSLRAREGASFVFDAPGYNVYLLRGTDISASSHTYRVTPRTRATPMTLRVDVLREDVYRVRLAMGDAVPVHDTPMVCADIIRPVDVRLDEHADRYRLSTPAMSVEVFKERFRIEVRDAHGRLVTESGAQTHSEWAMAMDSWPLGFVRDRPSRTTFAVESFTLFPGEAVHGLGEKFSAANRVGQTIGLWNAEGIGNTTARAYKHVPFFLSTRGYGVFVNESRPITCWVGSREIPKHVIAVESDALDYYVFVGEPRAVLSAYTDLTGKAAMPPRWSFGTWMSRISYNDQGEVLATAARLREERFPCDVIHLDTHWSDVDWKCDWTFNSDRFPDPPAMFARLRDLGFHASLWQTPYVIDDMDVAAEAGAKGVLAQNHGPFFFLVYPSHVIDISDPDAVAWYQAKLRALLEQGASVIKADFGEGVERHMRFASGDGTTMHNLYPLLYAKAVHEVTERTTGQGIIWARSAWAGSQRYPGALVRRQLRVLPRPGLLAAGRAEPRAVRVHLLGLRLRRVHRHPHRQAVHTRHPAEHPELPHPLPRRRAAVPRAVELPA